MQIELKLNVPENLSLELIQKEVKKLEEKLNKIKILQQGKKNKTKKGTPARLKEAIKRIEAGRYDLGEYTERFKQDCREFRESFCFKSEQ